MDPFSFVIGFVIGIFVANLVAELILYKGSPGKVSTKWDLSKERELRICATRISNVKLPDDARILVREGVPPEISRRCIVRRKSEIAMNFAVSEDRAFLFLGGEISEGSPAFIATDDAIIKEFSRTFKELWEGGKTLVYEKVPSERIAEYIGSFVSIRGVIINPLRVLEGGRFKIISEEKVINAILSPSSRISPEEVMRLRGANVEIVGRIVEGPEGPEVEVYDIRKSQRKLYWETLNFKIY